MIEMRASHVKALPAEKFEAGGVAGDGEGKRLALRVGTKAMVAGMIDGQLIGNGPQGGQQPAALQDDPGVRLAHNGQCHVFMQGVHQGGRAAPLQVHQGVGEGYVLLAEECIVMQHVLLELRAILGEVVRGTSPGGKEHVEKVRRAPHHPTTGPGPVGHHGAASLQVGNTLGHQKRQAHWLAGGGRGVRHLLPQRWVMLHIVEGRHGADPIAQGRMGGHILHLLTIDPHLPRMLFESGDVFLSGTC
jgi:hypothetical protein